MFKEKSIFEIDYYAKFPLAWIEVKSLYRSGVGRKWYNYIDRPGPKMISSVESICVFRQIWYVHNGQMHARTHIHIHWQTIREHNFRLFPFQLMHWWNEVIENATRYSFNTIQIKPIRESNNNQFLITQSKSSSSPTHFERPFPVFFFWKICKIVKFALKFCAATQPQVYGHQR